MFALLSWNARVRALRGGMPLKDHFITGIKQALQELIPERRIASLTEDSQLRDLGIDSVDMVRLITKLEEVFRVSFSADELAPENFRDIAALIRLLAGKHAEVAGHDPLLPA
jgi:acyl carrier protein